MKGKNAFLLYKNRINSLQIWKKVIHSMHIQYLEIRTSQHNSNKKSKKTCWQRKREDDILIKHCSKGQWGSSLKTEQEIDTLQETTNVNKFMQERQRKAVTIEELIKWRVWSWLRINAGGVPNTCKSIDRSPACWTEIEANGWVIRKQPAHEDRDNPWKRGLRPDR